MSIQVCPHGLSVVKEHCYDCEREESRIVFGKIREEILEKKRQALLEEHRCGHVIIAGYYCGHCDIEKVVASQKKQGIVVGECLHTKFEWWKDEQRCADCGASIEEVLKTKEIWIVNPKKPDKSESLYGLPLMSSKATCTCPTLLNGHHAGCPALGEAQ